ncbi:two-component sensor histidine kinase [Sphaerisporangium melleum]|uniref:histidine kinase n=1 Tax=Sphaerisporangium melleum TaxID=321316 RepID=A0A917QYL6_9ACTN|nr:sensor histidine kinase [Sphaerisporangium melleum]GGK75436.1 two-component sensor histidine kinase [Sphaerisporangium melleum]GII72634.1 two-component sensor histidine kinase [Sphaerisporangium melleum]
MSRVTRLREAARSHPYLVDTAIACLVFAGTLLSPRAAHVRDRLPFPPPTEVVPPSTAMVVLAAVLCAALVFRRAAPRLVAAVTVAGSVAQLIIAGTRGPLDLIPAVALVTLAVHSPRQVAWTAGGIAALVLGATRIVLSDDSWLTPQVAGQIAWIGMAIAAGDAVRSRRAYIAAIEERARRAEQTREEEAERRVMEERLRIARELHDVLAHHIALINVQAQVAAHVLADERQAREALGHIRQAGRAALEELRTTVGLLRRPGSAEELPTEPAPGLDRLPELITSFTAAGLPVDCRLEGTPRPLPSPVELTAFRVVQEALTNVSKHAGPAVTRVRIAYGPHDLTVEVSDDGRGCPQQAAGLSNGAAGDGPAGPGHGLVGMRERALSVGGTFSVGPSPGRGFRVHAVLPAPAASGA